MNIAAFVFAYPVLSETFVINELFQLQQMGVTGNIWREQQGNGAKHPKVGRLKFPVNDCPKQIWGSSFTTILSAHWWWLARHPLRYLKLLFEVVRLFPDMESFKIFLKAVVTAQEVLRSNADLVYVHESDRAFVFGLCAARLSQLPLIVIFHTYYLFVKKRYVESKIFAADGVIFQSEYSKRVVIDRLGLVPPVQRKLHVISSPGTDPTFFIQSNKLNSRAHLSQKKILRILSVGRLEEAKGFEYLLHAVKILKEKGVHLSCRIVGEGTYRKRLENLQKALSLESDVVLVGSLPHGELLQREFQEADIFILPSVQDSEGVHDVHPNVVKEAMSSGLIVVTTKLGGIDEVINNGQDGMIIDDAQPESIVRSVVQILQLSEQQRARVESSAREKILTSYDTKAIISKMLSMFKKYVQ